MNIGVGRRRWFAAALVCLCVLVFLRQLRRAEVNQESGWHLPRPAPPPADSGLKSQDDSLISGTPIQETEEKTGGLQREHLIFHDTSPPPVVFEKPKIEPEQDHEAKIKSSTALPSSPSSSSITITDELDPKQFKLPAFKSGTTKLGATYNRTLVIARLKDENVDWVYSGILDADLVRAVYTVDDPDAPLTVPKNKGHEVMPYLTHIINNYDNLTDVTIFMHAHLITWHNNDLLDSNSAKIVDRLSSQRVIREGYMNLRCHHDPGCPDHIHTTADDDTLNKPEVKVFGDSWKELLPQEKLPEVLSQPCCAQFALSRDRIQSIPLHVYQYFRQWLLDSPLEDSLSGRVWEYIYQYIWAGVAEFCPSQSVCYCDGYGICFGGEDEYDSYFADKLEIAELENQLQVMNEKHDPTTGAQALKSRHEKRIQELRESMDKRKREAFERGRNPENRALEAGREWKEGDGF